MILNFLIRRYLNINSSSSTEDSAELLVSVVSQVDQAESIIKFGFRVSLLIHMVIGKLAFQLPLVGNALIGLNALIEMNHHERSTTRAPSLKEFNINVNDIWDLVVIGSGPGGAIAAWEAVNKGMKVLVIEKGGREESGIKHHSLDQLYQMFAHGGQQVILGPTPIAYAQGEVFGGGSQVNSGLYHRTPEVVRQFWAEKCKVSASQIEQAELEVEKILGVELQNEMNLGIYKRSPIIQFSENMNWNVAQIPRWRRYKSVDEFDHAGMSETYLRLAEEKGGRVVVNCEVTRIEPKHDSVKLQVSNKNSKYEFVSKKVCLSAGPIETPRILIRSKLARPKDFSIGFHAMTRVVAEFDREVNDLSDIDPFQSWTENYENKFGAGVASSALIAGTLKLQKINHVKLMNPKKIGVYYSSTVAIGRSRFIKIFRTAYPFFTMSRKCKTEIMSSNEMLRKAIKSIPNTRILTPIARRPSVTSVHIFGSMPIGRSKLLDEKGRLRGYETKVRVIDSSILPSAPRVNPQGPAMMLFTILAKDV